MISKLSLFFVFFTIGMVVGSSDTPQYNKPTTLLTFGAYYQEIDLTTGELITSDPINGNWNVENLLSYDVESKEALLVIQDFINGTYCISFNSDTAEYVELGSNLINGSIVLDVLEQPYIFNEQTNTAYLIGMTLNNTNIAMIAMDFNQGYMYVDYYNFTGSESTTPAFVFNPSLNSISTIFADINSNAIYLTQVGFAGNKLLSQTPLVNLPEGLDSFILLNYYNGQLYGVFTYSNGFGVAIINTNGGVKVVYTMETATDTNTNPVVQGGDYYIFFTQTTNFNELEYTFFNMATLKEESSFTVKNPLFFVNFIKPSSEQLT
ncbi:hypothetical protein PPL_02257 [Heterostelium album PN500]|uniref:Uncharacterized protein n=1 Tax=Heterostelium pallidum (strain ATCC 26659 / Pp 5 / PN500) TaxID=670386 RepID=D3B1T3_HETP5|nr:hypothetical protein PPL_02257 [Heterostelium album PN500]EFA85257.1 hypothetical protein PPL_02257 [Heterostelium album PN500]|eukprot:XP_020437366.1 hypothetical protein PPL_02257 [Heterostelium album PN500]